eukprot:TRINITY_DN39737_c0_g1_i1.p1 TRINITY_DN39737_c0_g1~~TRINITY_DN39737_c0_g1_i1.p1  ORF type:complete len:800 (-),score=96.24 TRINITY_DN39737_c0_g1_i1:64-2178(-)
MGRVFVAEGEIGLKRVSQRLDRKRWTAQETESVNESDLGGFNLPGTWASPASSTTQVQALIPPGEGWVRHDETKLVDPRSQVYFVQLGDRAGQYLKRKGKEWEQVSAPHAPQEFAMLSRAANGYMVRQGTKLDRAVLLNDITKIARLALKFPLSFVDTPASAYALFQGHRSAEAAQWCAENFHKKLLPILAEKVHTYEPSELQAILERTLTELDTELLGSTSAFSGCTALVVLVLGSRVTVAGVGHVRAVLLKEGTKGLETILSCTGSLSDTKECKRIQEAGGHVHASMVRAVDAGTRDGWSKENAYGDAQRILHSKHAFDVLEIEASGPADEKQVRSAYRRLALRVHPDKQGEGSDVDTFKLAFSKLDEAKETLESLLTEDAQACREMGNLLRSEVHTRGGAASLLGVDGTAQTDTDQVGKEAEKACKALVKKLERLQTFPVLYAQAVTVCEEAVQTLRRGCSIEALPRYEALLREGVASSRAMGCRDLRRPYPQLLMTPESASWRIPETGRWRLGLLCGATAALDDEQLSQSVSRWPRRPKATALRWCHDAVGASSAAVCISFEPSKASALAPAAKKPRQSSAGPEGTMRLRHILFSHGQLRQADPMLRREASSKTVLEAEGAALAAQEKLTSEPNQFAKLCRELSDCQTAAQPGLLSGDLGWVGKGQLEPAIEEAVFSLAVDELSDVVASSRGVHIFQRLA